MLSCRLRRFDIEFRRLARQIVGPPPGIDWNLPWHEVLHVWHERVSFFVEQAEIPNWSQQCATQYWNFACYVHELPPERWICRALAWNPSGTRIRGRLPYAWDANLEAFARFKNAASWHDFFAQDAEQYRQEFLAFLLP